jgi:hypothetical protein
MNRIIVVVCILLTAASIIGFMACNHPMVQKDPMNQLEKTGKSYFQRSSVDENATPLLTMPAVMGSVMFSMDGQIIGILFSTPEGDFCESQNGNPAGFIALNEKRQQPF